MDKQQLRERKDFTTVRELIEWAGETYGGRCAYSFRNKPLSGEIIKISFAQLRDHIRALATELRIMGCTDRHCAIIGKPCYQWAVLYFAILSAGGVAVPLDRDWTPEDLADTAEKAEVRYVFCENALSEKAEYIANHVNLSCAPVFFTAGNDGSALSVDGLIESGSEKFNSDPDAYFNVPIDPVKLSLLVFTSGTTGKGKGVMLSQNAVLEDMSSVIPYIDTSDKTVSVLPWHHTYGSTIMLIGHAMIGSEMYISSGVRYVPKEMKEQKPGHLVLVPLYLETFYRKIMAGIKEQGKEKLVMRMIKVSNALRRVGIDKRDTFFASIRAAFGGKVRMIISGGAPINPSIVNFFDGIGISILNGYGITECAPLISVNRSRHIVNGSVGQIINADIVIIDSPNADGEGEILVKGPNVMLGYYKNTAATADAFSRGYFRTGDYGKLDRDNTLFITGRKKNLIILSNGKNVYPEEIENELAATPGIADIIVYEGQSRRGTEYNAVVAEIYPDREFFEKENITDAESYFRTYIDNYNRNTVQYKKIGIVKVRKTEFPKNTLRKIMRFRLDTSID